MNQRALRTRFAQFLSAGLLAAATSASGIVRAETAAPAPAAKAPAPYHLGAHAERDVGTLLALKRGAAFAGGVVYGPFRAGYSW